MSTEITEIPCPRKHRVCPMSMSGEEWPPKLKPLFNSPEFDYMAPYLTVRSGFPFESYKKFLTQAEENRGYDVPGSYLPPLPDALLEEGRPLYNQQCKFVVDKINDQAKMHGEFYVFQSVEKLVFVTRRRVKLFTFTVKEVASNRLKTVRACLFCETCIRIHIHGWHFKPDDNPPSSSCLFCETCTRIHIHGWHFKPDDNPPSSSKRKRRKKQRPKKLKEEAPKEAAPKEAEGEWIQKGEGERTLWSLKGEGKEEKENVTYRVRKEKENVPYGVRKEEEEENVLPMACGVRKEKENVLPMVSERRRKGDGECTRWSQKGAPKKSSELKASSSKKAST